MSVKIPFTTDKPKPASSQDARAAWVSKMIQGTMALEGQGLTEEAQRRLHEKVKQLMQA